MEQKLISKAKTEARQIERDWGTMRWLAGRELGNSDDMTVGHVTIKPGMCNPRHGHPNCDEVLYLLDGTLEHTLGDETIVMHAGDTLSVKRGVFHNARNIGNSDAQLFVAFSSADRLVQDED